MAMQSKWDLPSLTLLRQFVEVERTKGMGRAARKLGLSQSAVSKNMRRLEETVGAELFSRHTRGTQLTSAGEGFLHHSKRILIEYDHAVEIARMSADAGREIIRLGAGVVFSTLIIPQALSIFRKRHSTHRVQIRTLSVERIDRDLEMRRIDLAMHAAEKRASSAIIRQPVCVFRRAILCAASHPLAQVDPTNLNLARVADYPFVSLPLDNLQMRQLEYMAYDQNAGPLSFTLECDNLMGAFQILRNSNHLLFGSAELAGWAASDIVALPLSEDLGHYKVGFSYRADSEFGSPTRALMSAVKQVLNSKN